jgi:hypothetical protein
MLRFGPAALLTGALLASPAFGQDSASATKEQPLFASHDPLRLALEADWGAVFKERGDSSTPHPAKLTLTGADGATTRLDVEVQTRGHFRLQRITCNFPPIRVSFPKDEIKKTVFAGQRHLKLTVHCQDKKAGYEQAVLLEYLIYRTFNLLTEQSFRARLAQVTYLDVAGKRDSLTRYAFFIENDDRMAARLGGKILDRKNVHDETTELKQRTLVAVFEYFIGNTDWSIWALHNIVLVLPPESQEPFAVPYDFDWSGVIDAPYAQPDVRLPIKSVRERLFRGYCRTREELAPVFQLFNEKKDAIYALYREQEGLDPKARDDALKYYDAFYKTINDPKAVDWAFIRNCRHVSNLGASRPTLAAR